MIRKGAPIPYHMTSATPAEVEVLRLLGIKIKVAKAKLDKLRKRRLSIRGYIYARWRLARDPEFLARRREQAKLRQQALRKTERGRRMQRKAQLRWLTKMQQDPKKYADWMKRRRDRQRMRYWKDPERYRERAKKQRQAGDRSAEYKENTIKRRAEQIEAILEEVA